MWLEVFSLAFSHPNGILLHGNNVSDIDKRWRSIARSEGGGGGCDSFPLYYLPLKDDMQCLSMCNGPCPPCLCNGPSSQTQTVSLLLNVSNVLGGNANIFFSSWGTDLAYPDKEIKITTGICGCIETHSSLSFLHVNTVQLWAISSHIVTYNSIWNYIFHEATSLESAIGHKRTFSMQDIQYSISLQHPPQPCLGLSGVYLMDRWINSLAVRQLNSSSNAKT